MVPHKGSDASSGLRGIGRADGMREPWTGWRAQAQLCLEGSPQLGGLQGRMEGTGPALRVEIHGFLPDPVSNTVQYCTVRPYPPAPALCMARSSQPRAASSCTQLFPSSLSPSQILMNLSLCSQAAGERRHLRPAEMKQLACCLAEPRVERRGSSSPASGAASEGLCGSCAPSLQGTTHVAALSTWPLNRGTKPLRSSLLLRQLPRRSDRLHTTGRRQD